MKRPSLLGIVLVVLACAHAFPLTKHGTMPVTWYARGLAWLAARRGLLLAASALLVAAHLVPAADHLPRFVLRPSWADGWRGIGATVAMAWFASPLSVQAAVIGRLRGSSRVRMEGAMSRLSIVLATGAVFVVGVWFGAREIPASHAAPPAGAPLPRPAVLHVPHAAEPLALDGELDEPAWPSAARTQAFVRGDGTAARPYSEARVTWRDGMLYLALYAADEDIRSTDTFHVFFEGPTGERGLDVTAEGKTTPRLATWGALPSVGRDADGTVDDPSDDDEEWLVEVAVPLAELGLKGERGERVSFAVRRCDTPKGGRRTCGQWGGEVAGILVLD